MLKRNGFMTALQTHLPPSRQAISNNAENICKLFVLDKRVTHTDRRLTSIGIFCGHTIPLYSCNFSSLLYFKC